MDGVPKWVPLFENQFDEPIRAALEDAAMKLVFSGGASKKAPLGGAQPGGVQTPKPPAQPQAPAVPGVVLPGADMLAKVWTTQFWRDNNINTFLKSHKIKWRNANNDKVEILLNCCHHCLKT